MKRALPDIRQDKELNLFLFRYVAISHTVYASDYGRK